MRFGILGRVVVVDDDGAPVDIGGGQPRILLAMLLLARTRVVPTDSLIDAVWGESPPASALGSLHTYVSRIRRAIGAELLLSDGAGYRLAVADDDVDAWRFERLVEAGRAALARGDAATARDLLVEADAQWRGPALYEIRDLEVAAGAAARLEELRLVAIEDRLAADLDLGRHDVAAGELAELVAANPYREGLRVQLAIALYRSGRQADALRSITEARRTLADDLGLDPSPELRAAETAILGHDPALLRTEPAPTTTPIDHPSGGTRATPDTVAGGSAGRELRDGLVGRDAEMDLLDDVLDEATAATRFVVIEGEPGIGKTRLAEELAAAAADRGATVVWGRCYEGGAAPAFWPWLGALRTLIGAIPECSSSQLRQLLAPASDPSGEPGPANRFTLYEAVGEALVTASRDRPLVVVIDDLQWADEASLELLGHLAGTLDAHAILIVVAVRDVEVGRTGAVVDCLAAIARRRTSRRFRLRGLYDGAISELVEATTGRHAPEEVAAAITERVDGNPFFAIELAKFLQQQDGAGAGVVGTVPAGVRDVVRQRVARLPDATVDTLRLAALVGREVDAAVLMRASGGSAAVLDDLEPALERGVLVEVAERPGTVRFSHALVREVLADDVSPLQRTRLHARIADALTATGDHDDEAEIVAQHLVAAGPAVVPDRVADALERAAAVAVRRSAYAAAEDLLERAVRARQSAPSSPDGASAELDALVSLFFVQRIYRGHQAAVEGPTMRRAQSLAAATNRTDVLARLVWAEWVGVDKARDVVRSAELTGRLRELASATDDLVVRGLALHATGVACWHAGDLAGAVRALDEAVVVNRAAQERRNDRIERVTAPLRPTAWPQGHPVVPFVHMLVGDRDDPLASYGVGGSTGVPAPDRPFEPFDMTVVWMFAGFGALATGDLARAKEYAQRGIDADPHLAFSYWGFGSQLCLAAALVAGGDVNEGLALLEVALPRYVETRTLIFVALVHASVARGLARDGRLDDAERSLAASVEACHAQGERWVEPIAIAVGAEISHRRGAPLDEVGAAVRGAIALAREQGANAVADGIARSAAEAGITA